ncbi:hypothetical protein DRP53_02235 [candidate division WOR-3 bacterium]|uniref:Uncharacterized protein n=1 Tax=candidate division WOR-3 bacterium TaxID=2052148 RepID=A0A660SKC6_UNCW3|nr:MAG: hypothetical protein DRP53_02235 [candidate division WOR-3 bacterium]
MNEISEVEKKILKSFSEKIDPNDAGAHNNLAVVYYNKGLYNEAIELLNRALEIDPNFVLAQNNLDIVLKKSGKWHEYIDNLLKEIADDPLNINKRMKLADSYRKIGNHAQAVSEYHRILEIDPNNSRAYYGLGLVYKTIGKNENAIANFKRALEIEPENPKYLHLLGEVYFHQGNIDKSIEYYKKGLKLDPNSAEGHFMLGFALGEKGSYEEAMAELKKAVELNPELAQIQPNLPIDISEHRTFAQLLAKSAEGQPERKEDSRLNLADSFLNRGLFDEAKKELRKILTGDPKHFPSLLRMAKIETIQHNISEAAKLVERASETYPDDVELLNLKGVLELYRGNIEDAEKIFRIATESVKNYGPAINNLGLLRLMAGSDSEAIDKLELAHSLGTPQASWNLGLYYLNKDKPKEALEKLAGPHPKLRYGQALGLIRMDREESALKILEDVAKEIPNFAPVYYQLGFLLSKLGDFKNSLTNMKRGFELDPNFEKDEFQLALDNNFEYSLPLPEIERAGFELFGPGELELTVTEEKGVNLEELFKAGQDLYQSGRLNEARSKLEELLSQDPSHLPAKKLLIEILITTGEIEQARQQLKEIATLEDDVEILSLRARLARIEANRELLEEIYRKIIVIDNHNVEAISFLAELALKREKITEAEGYVKQLQEFAPDNYETHLLLGLLAVKKKDIDRATLEFERVIAIDPRQPLPYYHLGLLYAQKGRFQEAINGWKKCLLLNPPEDIAEKTRRCLEVTLELEDFLKREGEIV